MARKPKTQDIPVFTKEDTCGLHRFLAFLSYFFPLGTLIMWIVFHKKSKFIRMHARNCFVYHMTIIVTNVVMSLLLVVIGVVIVLSGGEVVGSDPSAIFGTLLAGGGLFAIVAIVFGIVDVIFSIAMFITILVSIIRALCGKLDSLKNVKLVIREQLNLGNPEAFEIIKTDARFADILAKYNANQARTQQAANMSAQSTPNTTDNNTNNTNTPDGDAK